MASSTPYTPRMCENAYHALLNIGGHLDTLLAAIREDVEAIERAEAAHADAAGALAYLRETITEHLRAQYPDSVSAAREHCDADPLVSRLLGVDLNRAA